MSQVKGHPSDPEETQAAMGRVSAFLIRWSEMRGVDYVHSLDGGDYELTTQDLRTLLGGLHRIEIVDSIRKTNADLIERNGELLAALEDAIKFLDRNYAQVDRKALDKRLELQDIRMRRGVERGAS